MKTFQLKNIWEIAEKIFAPTKELVNYITKLKTRETKQEQKSVLYRPKKFFGSLIDGQRSAISDCKLYIQKAVTLKY